MTENVPELGKKISVHVQEASSPPTDRAGKNPATYHHRHAKYTQRNALCRQQGGQDKTMPAQSCSSKAVMTRGKTKPLHDKNSLKEFMTTKPALRNILEGILKLREKTKPSVKLKGRINHARLIVKTRRENQTLQDAQNGRNQCTPFNNDYMQWPRFPNPNIEDQIKEHEPSICCLQENIP